MKRGTQRGFGVAQVHVRVVARVVVCLAIAGLTACVSERSIDLEAIYGERARASATTRTPVVVLPGVLGSKLHDPTSQRDVWGAFQFGAVDPDIPADARLFALPMAQGVSLAELGDGITAPDALDSVKIDIGVLRGLELGAYVNLLQALAVGKYRDSALAPPDPNAVQYGGLHYTCWQHPYDWRREISTQAAALDADIRRLQETVRRERGLAPDADVKVDLLCHSMGGLLGQWYLRYGAQTLPAEGPMSPPTWEGARNIRKFIMVATPSGGSLRSLRALTEGLNLNPLFPNYRPSVIGTFPSLYQLLPPSQFERLRDANGNALNAHDVATWQRYQWGLLEPAQATYLAWLLPEVKDATERQAIARDHVRKCLDAATRFHEALMRPSTPPEHLRVVLFAGDALKTEAVFAAMPAVGSTAGALRVEARVPGDGEVTRVSALADAAVVKGGRQPPARWIDFDATFFLPYEHLEITERPEFIDNLLFELLERD
ncbi:MAG: hypothetical protein RL591_1439 [Planctomycetota bacterium]